MNVSGKFEASCNVTCLNKDNDIFLVFGGHQEAPDGVASLQMYLDSHLITYILKAFAKPLGIGDNHVYAAVFLLLLLV